MDTLGIKACLLFFQDIFSFLHSTEILDERERLGSKEKNLSNSSFRFPGEKTVKFSAKLPKMNAATPVEEWLPNEYQVNCLSRGDVKMALRSRSPYCKTLIP